MNEHDIGESAYDWEETDKVDELRKKHAEIKLERAKAYAHVFGHDPLGKRILSEWINLYCTGAPPGNDASMRQVSMRDGKQELIAMIIQQIQIASGEHIDE